MTDFTLTSVSPEPSGLLSDLWGYIKPRLAICCYGPVESRYIYTKIKSVWRLSRKIYLIVLTAHLSSAFYFMKDFGLVPPGSNAPADCRYPHRYAQMSGFDVTGSLRLSPPPSPEKSDDSYFVTPKTKHGHFRR